MKWLELFRSWLTVEDEEEKDNYRVVKTSRYDARLLRGVENDNGTFGTLYYKDIPLCVTVEDKWRNNEYRVSCIPAGVYKCTKYSGTKYKNVWILHNVPNRSAILIHWGNTEDHTEGCIIVGSMFGNLGKKKAVLRSKEAFARISEILPDTFWLRVEDAVLNNE